MNSYSPQRVRVGVAGATGFAGQELMAILARHPNVDLKAGMSSSADSAARPLPRLARVWNGAVEGLNVDRLASETDVTFLALPEAAAADVAPPLIKAGVKVIDLSGAFRIRDDADRAKWYPGTKAIPPATAYGLVEHYPAEIAKAQLVACPGCYPTAALLSLMPLSKAGLLDTAAGVVIDAKSGISGAGKAATERTHFSENHGSVAAYGVLGHRHVAEMQQELGTEVTFVPHLVPLDRGILETIYVKTKPGVTADQIDAALHAAYADAPFVRLTGGVLPEIKHVAYSNFCDIGWKFEPATRRLVLIAVLDNLVKGAAGQAVQNFNVIYGFDQKTGLL
ncbi:MAG: N-acetyl-gamma-glutamyl-phosphate reductase [Acidobacteria bacterium]|nr:MAG: N-acetyl-gamma-glutamyl-phosphate reductase [Acidobacteriota bacterium]